MPRIGRLLVHACAVARRELRHRVAHPPGLGPRTDHQDHARSVAGAQEDVLGPGGTVEEVPRPKDPLLTLDEERALPGENQKILLLRLPVVAAVRLARPE